MNDIGKIPYKQIEKFPDPYTKTPLNQISDKDKARIIFKQAYDMDKTRFIMNVIASDLLMQNYPIDGPQ